MDGYTLLAHLMKCCITDDKSRIFPNLSSLISGRKQTVLLAKLVLQSMPEIAVLKPTTMSVKVGVSEYLLHTKAFVTLVCKRFWKRNFDKIGFFIIVPLSNIFIFSKRKDKIGRKMFEKYYEAHDGLSGFEQKAVWSDVGRKVAKFTKGGQIVARRSFYRKGYVFSKEFYYVWATFERKFVAETFKNCPIWSHWFQV